MKEKIEIAVKKALEELAYSEVPFVVNYSNDGIHGDFAVNVAMVLGKKLGENPKDLALKIIESVKSQEIPEIEKIEVAGPGFINFHLSNKFFFDQTKNILNNEGSFGKTDELNGEKAIFEYTDPNAFKEFHIGHLMSNTIGEALTRLYESVGGEVTRVSYQSDIGLNVAKAIWGMIQTRAAFPEDGDSLEDKMKYVGDSYSFGSREYEKDEDTKKEINEINKKLYAKSDKELEIYYDKGREWSILHFEEIYKKLGTDFKHNFFESQIADRGLEIVKENLAKGIFEESDGAVVYKGEQDGFHTRVFINSLGLPTYEAKDLALAEEKKKVLGDFDLSVIITAVEQKEYFNVVKAVMAKIYPELAEVTKHISHGMIRFAEGKMSSRSGNIITGESLILDVEKLVEEKLTERNLSPELAKSIREEVAVSAIKYSILKQAPGKDIVFDFEKSLSFEGDSGPYLQYTAVRAKSVLEKALASGVVTEEGTAPHHWNTTSLERILYRLPEVIKRAQNEFAPQHLVTYLTEVASTFNSFYGEQQIIDTNDPNTPYRLALTHATVIILRNGLNTLGIKVPSEM